MPVCPGLRRFSRRSYGRPLLVVTDDGCHLGRIDDLGDVAEAVRSARIDEVKYRIKARLAVPPYDVGAIGRRAAS